MRKSSSRPVRDQLCEHACDLQYLHKSRGSVQKSIIEESRPSLVKVLVLLAGNILDGSITLSTDQRDKLKRYARAIRELVHGSKKTTDRKKLLVKHTNQQGGFLGFLIEPIVKLVSSLIPK